MSRSCQSGTFSKPATRVAAQHAREAADALARDRVALVRHRRGALLAARERLRRLAHLAALEVADLGREAVERAAEDRERGQQLGVAVAPDDLRGDVLAAEAERRAARAPRRAGRRCRRRRRRPRACRRRRRRRRARRRSRLRRRSYHQPSSLSPNVVGSACTPCVRPMHGVLRCSQRPRQHRGERAVEAGEQLDAGRAQLQREPRVDDVGGRQAVVEPARLLAHLLGDRLGERDHVVVRAPLDLPGALDQRRVGARALAHGRDGARRHDAQLLPGRPAPRARPRARRSRRPSSLQMAFSRGSE